MKIKKHIFLFLLILIIFINLLSTHSLATTPEGNTPEAIISETNIPEPNFKIYSNGAVLIDSNTGKVLAGKDIDKKVYPASTTKILTAIIAIENCNLDDNLTASRNAVMCIPSGYSNAGIQAGETISFRDLLDMFLIHSANEVGYIFAEHIAGSVENFADLMNKKAAEIGCTNTHFTNPSGIHDVEHYTTAYDMALIARYCMQNQTFRDTVSKVSCKIAPTDKYQERYFKNTNDLIDSSSKYYYEYAIGIKTGFTTQAKNCLIAASVKDNVELITVALGAEATDDGRSGRYVDTINLFNYGFENYKFQEIVSANTVVQEIVIQNATKDTKNLPLLIKSSISTTVATNFDLNSVDYEITLDENITAPIAKGKVLGKISYTIDGIEYSSDLIAANDVEKSNFLLIVMQIILAIFILIILVKLVSPKKNKKVYKNNNYSDYKNKKSKNYKKPKKSKTSKNVNTLKRKCDPIYKFQ